MGNGVALWFEVSDFEAAVARIRTCGATVQTEPHMNPTPASMRSGCATPTAIWSCWPGRPSGAFDIPANAGISKVPIRLTSTLIEILGRGDDHDRRIF